MAARALMWDMRPGRVLRLGWVPDCGGESAGDVMPVDGSEYEVEVEECRVWAAGMELAGRARYSACCCCWCGCGCWSCGCGCRKAAMSLDESEESELEREWAMAAVIDYGPAVEEKSNKVRKKGVNEKKKRGGGEEGKKVSGDGCWRACS